MSLTHNRTGDGGIYGSHEEADADCHGTLCDTCRCCMHCLGCVTCRCNSDTCGCSMFGWAEEQ